MSQKIIISAFADEAANRRTVLEQMTALSSIGLSYYSPRFIDIENNGTIKHVVELSDDEFSTLRDYHSEYGMSVTSIGSRVGKIKLLDVDDGSHNKYVEIGEYLDTEVAMTVKAAKELGTKLIRGFSFYHPRGTEVRDHLAKAAENIRKIVDVCAANDLVYGVEIEPNLVGEVGSLVAELVAMVDHPNVVSIYDGGNIAAQNKKAAECFEEYVAMRPSMGWMHVKDYAIDPSLVWEGAVDEDRLKNFVPCDSGDSGYTKVLADLKEHLPALNEKAAKLGLPGFFLETEPHLKGGGQFGGFSGPDGMGVAVRTLCSVLDSVGIEYDLRGFDSIREIRGY